MNDNEYDFYANSVQLVGTTYDLTLYFRVQSHILIEEGSQPILETSGICNVRMSPQLAKALAALLVKQTIEYEEKNNLELPVPPKIKELWNKYLRKGA